MEGGGRTARPDGEKPLFRPLHDRLLRGGLLLGAVFAVLLAAFAWGGWRGSRWEQIALAPGQPVPFSHRHHAGELGIDCRFCHTGVEGSSFAGLPSTRTCMTCHSQVWKDAPVLEPLRASAATGRPVAWKRVTEMPDFVYFNHSAHVARGVACVSCHGPVAEMPRLYQAKKMEMRWCLECHRHPDATGVPRDRVADPRVTPRGSFDRPLRPEEKARLTNCSTCHR